MPHADAATAPPVLGLDAGGTLTRWALAWPDGRLAEGEVAGFSALQLGAMAARLSLMQTLQALAGAVLAHQRPARVVAGITGLGERDGPQARQLRTLLGEALGLADARVDCFSDIELACRAAFTPGEGVLVYAGTGAIAAYVDAGLQLHRAGGRGPVLGDEGGGFWIAREALARVWRGEDDEPGRWQRSALARRLFETLGGSDWAQTRAFVYGGDLASRRGAIGRLALAVAQAARDGDAQARELLHQAGTELGRLAAALLRRHGARPVATAGRAFDLHPLLLDGLRAALPAGIELRPLLLQAHVGAARTAALSSSVPTPP